MCQASGEVQSTRTPRHPPRLCPGQEHTAHEAKKRGHEPETGTLRDIHLLHAGCWCASQRVCGAMGGEAGVHRAHRDLVVQRCLGPVASLTLTAWGEEKVSSQNKKSKRLNNPFENQCKRSRVEKSRRLRDSITPRSEGPRLTWPRRTAQVNIMVFRIVHISVFRIS